jgi:hypothetical protein
MSSSFDPYAELASLFLTDEGPASRERHAPALELVRDDGPVENAAPPTTIGAMGHASDALGASAHPTADREPHELRLASSSSSSPSSKSSHPAPPLASAVTAPIEIAMVGHLPVMGGLWLTQYADHVGRREGPTALVRIERGQVTLELLRAPGYRGVLDRATTIDEAIAELASVASRWVICPANEASIDGPLPADALTLLTGGDDAATVAAYRIMKNLAERWHIVGWPVPPIGLVVLGSPPERVEEVVEKLDRTTKAFLDVDLAIVGQHQRMDAIESEGRRVFHGADLGSGAGGGLSVSDLCRRIRSHGGRERRAATIVSPRRIGAGGSAKLGPKPLGREVAPRVAEFEMSQQELSEPPSREGFDPFADVPFTPMHEDAGEVPTSAVSSLRETNASRAAAIPGLMALATRCPHQPAVELALDDAGTLHLVIGDDALAALRPVEAWVRAHAPLLHTAHPELRLPVRVAIDVVTSDAPTVASLHGAGLNLHLLIDTQYGQVHAPLSRPIGVE